MFRPTPNLSFCLIRYFLRVQPHLLSPFRKVIRFASTMSSTVPPPSEYILVYCPCENQDEALKISKILVEEDLIACANIQKGTSVYKWKGKVENGEETYMLMKTRGTLYDNVRTRIEQLHSYDVPCIVGWPLSHGNNPFLNWIHESTGGNS